MAKTCECFALVGGSTRCGQSLGKAREDREDERGDGHRLGELEGFMGTWLR